MCWNFNNGVQPKPLPVFQRRLGGRPQVSCRDFRREVCWKSKKVGDFLGIRFLTLRPDQWILKSSARCAVVTPLVDAKSDGGNPNFMAQTAGHTYTTSAKMSNPQDNKSYSYYIILLCLWRYMYITHMNLCIYIYEYDWICIYAYIEVIMMSSCNYYPGCRSYRPVVAEVLAGTPLLSMPPIPMPPPAPAEIVAR